MNSTTYHHGNLKQELITQALILISKSGVEQLSLRKLAAQCQVSQTALYRHFKNKEALLAVISIEGYQKLLANFQHASKRNYRCPEELLRKLGFMYIDFAQTRPSYFHVMYYTQHTASFNSDLVQSAADAVYQLLKGAFKLGIASNHFKPMDTDLLSFAGWSFLHGIATLIMQGKSDRLPGNSNDLASTLSQLMDLLIYGITTGNS